MATEPFVPRLRRGSKTIQFFMDQYREAHPDEGSEIRPELISAWVVRQPGLWKPKPISPQEQLRRLIVRNCRETYMIDPQGREVRANLPLIEEVMTKEGIKRRSRWYPLFEAPAKVAKASFALRRRSALADVVQMHFDWESYNDNNELGETLEPLDVNFEKDIAEMSEPTSYPTDPLDEDGDEEDEEL